MFVLVAQRIALGILLLLAVSVLIFVGTNLLPGEVAQSILGQSATPQALANLRESMHLNDPAYVRYFRWLVGVLHGDLGTAPTSGHDIAALAISVNLVADWVLNRTTDLKGGRGNG